MDFTILHFAIHIVWRANVICTYRKSGIARKTTVAYPELRLIAFIQMDDDKQKAFKAYVSATGDDSISDFEDCYEGKYDSEEDFATHIVNECYDLERMMGNLSYYFDYKAFARDLFISDYIFEDGYVFRR